MKLTRRRQYRNAGTKTLAETDLSTKKSLWSKPKYSEEHLMLTFEATGRDNNSNYRYTLSLTAQELMYFLDISVNTIIKDSASKAVGRGAVASLNALLLESDSDDT